LLFLLLIIAALYKTYEKSHVKGIVFRHNTLS